MEKKQLDLNQPLLSVRRFSSKLASSNEANKKKTEKPLPRKQHSLPIQKSEWDLGEVTKPAAVPFVWEQIPGKPKGENAADAQSPLEPSNTPRLPPGRVSDKQLVEEKQKDRNVFTPQIEASPMNTDIETLWESLRKRVKGEGDACDSESEGDDYSDAIDTLSPTNSLSMKCSESGFSYGSSDVRPCGNFCADSQTRDFMMKRFLPAAKAMVLDTTHHVPKKQPTTPERSRPVKKVVSGELRPLLDQQMSAIVPPYAKYKEERESEEGEDDVNVDSGKLDSGKKAVKAFGLFSRFCLKNSLCLLNPVPGMKVRTPRVPPPPPPKEVSRMARTAYSGPITQTADKHSSVPVYKPKYEPRSHSQELYKIKTKPNGESNRTSYSGDLHMMKGLSPSRSFVRGSISPYRNKAPPSPFREGVGFLGVTNDVESAKAIKGCRTFLDVSSKQRSKQVPGSMTPTVEKTVYVDSVNIVEKPLSEPISSNVESLKHPFGKDFVASVDGSRIEDNAAAESFVKDIKQPDIMEGLRLDQGQDLQSGSIDWSKLDTDGTIETKNENILKEDGQGNTNASSLMSPLPPPLPKSPSESWLWKTLPSISFRHHKKDRAKDPNTGTKWETIVKTSNVRHDHSRYSEELVPHVLKHSKT